MKLKFIIALSAIALAAFIVFSQIKVKPFAPAEDLPRGALIYVQIGDLPTFFKVWNESKLKEKHETSENFNDFWGNHLGLKILSRWDEFDTAAGFPLNLETFSKLANKQAAIAVYDIGKLEFVFAAPVTDEVFAATKFVQNKDKFTEETLSDGTTIYRAAVEADRGRQKQELIFTNAKGRFILATSEKLLMQTLNNINGGKTKNRLINEPNFKILSEQTVAHTATVWVNQTALNDDYYFKHYWLMSDAKELKNIRAGMFDFEMQEGKLIEKRRFLLNEKISVAPINQTQANEILVFLPENIPFYKLEKPRLKMLDAAIERTIFERRDAEDKAPAQTSSASSDDYTSGDYEYLGDQFDEAIDETDDETAQTGAADFDFSATLRSAAPEAILTFTEPRILPAPRFVEFRRAAVFHLAAPTNFNRAAFESAIEKNFAAQILVASPNVNVKWESKSENDASWRELDFPMLDQTAAYAVRGSELILTNDADFLREVLARKGEKFVEISTTPFSELTVINIEQRKTAFDEVFNRLEDKAASGNFFTGNISSLLDSISEVKRIEIKKNYSPNNFEEELIFLFQ